MDNRRHVDNMPMEAAKVKLCKAGKKGIRQYQIGSSQPDLGVVRSFSLLFLIHSVLRSILLNYVLPARYLGTFEFDLTDYHNSTCETVKNTD